MEITPLHPLFAARVTGLDLRQDVEEAEFARVREAFERYSVLVFPGQAINDAAQVRFSERFGPLEATRAGANGAGSKLIVLTNIGADGRHRPAHGQAGPEQPRQPALAFRLLVQAGPGPRLPALGPGDPVPRRRNRIRQHAGRLCGAAGRGQAGGRGSGGHPRLRLVALARRPGA